MNKYEDNNSNSLTFDYGVVWWMGKAPHLNSEIARVNRRFQSFNNAHVDAMLQKQKSVVKVI